MKLLFASNLNGNPQFYSYLVAQAWMFDAMFWVGSLIDRHAGEPAGQAALVESAAGEIQSQGCRVFACGGAKDHRLGPWLWLERQGAFVAPGLLVTMMAGEEADQSRLRGLRQAAWDAGALWIVVCSGPVVPAMLAAGASEAMLFWPRAALRFGPDVIVGPQTAREVHEESDWCQKRADTWVLTPGQASGGDYPEVIVLDTVQWRASRYSPAGIEQRDVSALRERMSFAGGGSRQVLAA